VSKRILGTPFVCFSMDEREFIPTDFVLPLRTDRKANRDTRSFTDRCSDLKLCAHLFGPRLHIG